jgi:hypothetical protein
MNDERKPSSPMPVKSAAPPATSKDLEISGPGAADFLAAPGGADFPGGGQTEGMAQTRDDTAIDSRRLAPDLDAPAEDVEKKWESPEAAEERRYRGRKTEP